MFANLILAIVSALVGVAVWVGPYAPRSIAVAFGGLALWQLYCALSRTRHPPSSPVLRMGGFAWSTDDFCRGWLVTGQTGTGKTASAVNTMLWQLTKNCPDWGGICVDDKGVYWETLRGTLRHFGREQDLILLEVRPTDAPADWKPEHTFNFLHDPYLPFSAKAKIICDVAASLGQRSEQNFFRVQAQVQMEWAFKALRCAGFECTLEQAYDLFANTTAMADLIDRLKEKEAGGKAEATGLLNHYEGNFEKQPPEQLGGVKSTILNYLKYFTDPAIAEVFCPSESNVRFDEIDRGKKICISLPQRFQVERRYINTLLKLVFYMHALRRFDRPAAERKADNILVLWADEAQKIVTAADDGISDYNVVDVIREARATVVAATQSYTSLIPPMGDERKAKVFVANMANRVTFCAADEDSAKIAADTFGQRKRKRRTWGYSAGKRTVSFTEENKYWFEPFQLRKLRKFEAVIQHCNGGFRRVKLRPCGADGKAPSWYQS